MLTLEKHTIPGASICSNGTPTITFHMLEKLPIRSYEVEIFAPATKPTVRIMQDNTMDSCEYAYVSGTEGIFLQPSEVLNVLGILQPRAIRCFAPIR